MGTSKPYKPKKHDNYDIDKIHLASNKRQQKFYFEGQGIIPTTNNLYLTMARKGGGFMRIPSPQLRIFKESIRQLVCKRAGCIQPKPGRWYAMYIKIYIPILTKEGKVRRWDISNRVKALEDAITEAIGMEDSYIALSVAEKINDSEQSVQSYRFSVEIRPY